MANTDDLGFVPDPTPAPAAAPSNDHSDLGFVADSESQDDSLLGALKRNIHNKSDMLRSMVHGATGGLDDEAIGALKAGGQKIGEMTGLADDSGKSFHDLYRQYQEDAQKDYKENVHNRNPIASGMSEFVGAAAPVVATAGMGGPAAESSAIQKIIHGMKTGAGYGAVSGFGGSEKNLDTLEGAEGVAKDTAENAGLGAAIGGAVPAAQQATSGLFNKALQSGLSSESPFVRQTAKAFDEGTKGLGFGGDSNRDRILKGTQDTAADITKQLGQGFQDINSKYGDVLKSSGAPIELNSDATQSLSDVASAIESGDVSLPKSKSVDMLDNLKQLMDGKLSAESAKQLQIDLRSMGSKVDGPMQSAFSDAARSIDQGLSKIPGYSDINSSFSKARTIPESVISKAPGDVNETYMSDLSKPDESTYKGFKNLIQNSQTSGSGSRASKESMLNFKSTLDNLKESSPETFKDLGINPDELMGKIKSQGDMDAIMQAVQGHTSQGGALSQILGGHTTKGVVYRTANYVGQAAGPLVNNSHTLVTAAPEELKGVADKLSQSPTLKHLGAGLSTALDNKSETMKNAALFSILQNPDARKAVFGDDKDEIK